jgi:type III pantothenate kinase
MNLALDFGNTRIKAAVFDGAQLTETQVFDDENDLLQGLGQFQGIKKCVIGSVTNAHEKASKHLSQQFHTLVFKADTPLPLKNRYKSALTLGSDRLAGSMGAYALYPNRNVLTIDAGTCIKYNFVNAANEYLGGAISPGLPMRLKAMHHYTHALPEVAMDPNYQKLVGQSTHESLLSGALVGAAAEVDGMIDRYTALYAGLQVVLTGGDASYLAAQLKNRFFTDPNLVLRGLNAILEFNSEK